MKLDSFVPRNGPEPAFHPFWSESRGRQLAKPNSTMHELQRRLLSYLRFEIFAAMPYAHGSVSGRSVLSNAEVHRYSRYFYITDLSSAYPSVDVLRLAEVLVSYDKTLSDQVDEVANWLARYCIAPTGGLYQGGAASPMLFNLYAHALIDARLEQFLATWHMRYSRYLDDLCFSSAQPIGQRKRRTIRSIITDAGFAVEHRKSRVVDRSKTPVVIAGVQITIDARIIAQRAARKRAAGAMHLARRGDLDPAVAHGVAGAVYAATQGGVDGKSVRQLRADQLALISRSD